MSNYSLDQIHELSAAAIGEGRVEIRYRPMIESLYYSPGVKVESSERGLTVQFVRCGINNTCDVTYAATVTDSGEYLAVIQGSDRDIFAADDGGSRKIYPD